MFTRLGLWFVSSTLVVFLASAQERSNRRSQRPAPIISPEILESGQVTFRLRAPNAEVVGINGQWPEGRQEMNRSENGVWELTMGPVPAGVWEYSFRVDGMTMIDPGNPAIKPMRRPRTSILNISGKPSLVHDFQAVPHGAVHQHQYSSRSLNRVRSLTVYTPPSYDATRQRRYPTLYLQHGSGDNQDTWIVHGKAHWILDNLIAQKEAVPMVVVMMDGHASMDRRTNTSAFARDLLEDVLPFVEKRYRVKRQGKYRGIVGLSMGGGQSLTVGLNHSDLFGWVGGFSSSAPSAESVSSATEKAKRTNRRLRLLWVACGKDDFLLNRNRDFVAMLSDEGVAHVWRLTEGNHSWPIWRDYLAQFLPKLFR